MRYLALFSPGPIWLADRPVGEQDRNLIDGHLANMRRQYDRGALLFGGPFTASLGGVALLEAENEIAAATIMDSDPAVAAGLMTYRLESVRPFFDVVSGRAWSA